MTAASESTLFVLTNAAVACPEDAILVGEDPFCPSHPD